MRKLSFFSSFASLLIFTGSLLANQVTIPEIWQDTWTEPGTAELSYQIRGFETSQSLVQLHDGSKWKVFSGDTVNMATWSKGQSVVIEIDFSWEDYRSGRPHTYHLINLTNNTKVSTHLIAGPNPGNPDTLKVNTLLIQNRQISLSDGSNWTVTFADRELLEHWKSGDQVLLGRVRRGNWSAFGKVLINLDAGNYVRARDTL